MAWVMQRTLKTSGAETLSAAANIFVGQTEAPLVVKPYVQTMTRSELHAIMTGECTDAQIAGNALGLIIQQQFVGTCVWIHTLPGGKFILSDV